MLAINRTQRSIWVCGTKPLNFPTGVLSVYSTYVFCYLAQCCTHNLELNKKKVKVFKKMKVFAAVK